MEAFAHGYFRGICLDGIYKGAQAEDLQKIVASLDSAVIIGQSGDYMGPQAEKSSKP